MSLAGRKKVIIKIVFLILVICSSAFADDFGIAMPDQLDKADDSFQINSNDEKELYIAGERDEIKTSGNETSPTLPDSVGHQKSNASLKARLLRADAGNPYEFEERPEMISIKNDEIINSIYNQGTSLFSFSTFNLSIHVSMVPIVAVPCICD